MSRICMLSGKVANTANNRSHSNRATKRQQGVNLQTRRLGGTKIRLSTHVLKTLRKFEAMERGEILSKRAKKRAKAKQEEAKS